VSAKPKGLKLRLNDIERFLDNAVKTSTEMINWHNYSHKTKQAPGSNILQSAHSQ